MCFYIFKIRVKFTAFFKKKMTIIADVFPEIADSEKRGSKNL